ncbi:hypothetical protein [Nocardia cyriacigeorgica]|uniref:hypothetical protein n=1 Tax=Nocardia cyriacigeorgica TaxID=135487 RepID=UPI00245710FB|nr:hypothetical protein [Nocardia cyriacigeorgica]
MTGHSSRISAAASASRQPIGEPTAEIVASTMSSAHRTRHPVTADSRATSVHAHGGPTNQVWPRAAVGRLGGSLPLRINPVAALPLSLDLAVAVGPAGLCRRGSTRVGQATS